MVAHALAAMLPGLGYRVSAPTFSRRYGWVLEARSKGRQFGLQVMALADRHTFWVVADDATWRFWRTRPTFQTFLVQLDAALKNDDRFRDIGWFSNEADDLRTPFPVSKLDRQLISAKTVFGGGVSRSPVKVRANVEFRTTFPDDTVEDGLEIVQFPGRGLAAAIAAMLTPLGYVVSAPFHMHELGWELDVGGNGHQFSLRVSQIDADENYISASDTKQLLRPDPGYLNFLSNLDAALRKEERIQLVGWFSIQSERERAPHPVQDR